MVKPLAVKETNLEPLWGWEEGCGGKVASSGAASAWVLPPMLAPRTSFGAAITTTLALGMPALPRGGANVGAKALTEPRTIQCKSDSRPLQRSTE